MPALDHARAASAAPAARLILLGASNLTRGISTVVDVAQQLFGAPLELHVALGHGRSYGGSSRALARTLPGINDCGLWAATSDVDCDIPTAALVTDIGNDLFYGAEAATILSWIESCISKLSARRARIAISMLPLMNLDRVSRRQFYFVRTIFFPGARIDYDTFNRRARQLDAQLRALCSAQQLLLIEPRAAWYGIDPIHFRARAWSTVWQAMLAPLVAERHLPQASQQAFLSQKTAGLRQWLYLRSRAPHERGLLGFTQRRAQPAGRLPSGTTIALY